MPVNLKKEASAEALQDNVADDASISPEIDRRLTPSIQAYGVNGDHGFQRHPGHLSHRGKQQLDTETSHHRRTVRQSSTRGLLMDRTEQSTPPRDDRPRSRVSTRSIS